MLLKGISTLVSLKREVEITEEDKKAFVKAVLTNSPFEKCYKVGPVEVICRSPEGKDYEDLGKISDKDSEFEFAVIKSILQTVSINDEFVYRKDDVYDDWLSYFQEKLGKSPLQVLVLGKVVHFYNMFIKLLQELLSPDFFEKIQDFGQSQEDV